MIIFANGVEVQETNVLRYSEKMNGHERVHLDLVFDATSTTLEEMEVLYDNPAAFKTIKIKTKLNATNQEIAPDAPVSEDPDANTTTYVYKDFDIPVSFTYTKSDSNPTQYTIRVAQKTVEEIQNDTIIETNTTMCLAFAELSAMVDILMQDYDKRTAGEAK